MQKLSMAASKPAARALQIMSLPQCISYGFLHTAQYPFQMQPEDKTCKEYVLCEEHMMVFAYATDYGITVPTGSKSLSQEKLKGKVCINGCKLPRVVQVEAHNCYA